jgi:hypothetical protein
VVRKLSARAALREWRAGWRRFFLAGAAPGGGGGGGGEDGAVEECGEVVRLDARGLRAVMRARRAARSASIDSRRSGSLFMTSFSQITFGVG